VLSLAGVVERDPNGSAAKSSARYPQTEFGIKIGTERTIASWVEAKKHDALHVRYLGQKKVPEVGDRVCYAFKRAPYDKPEEDGITEAVYYVDKETWLQVGSVLSGADGLIGAYYFRDIKLNSDFPPDTFTRKGLSR
jgi:outer membrane lipoprotein-sorting protein